MQKKTYNRIRLLTFNINNQMKQNSYWKIRPKYGKQCILDMHILLGMIHLIFTREKIAYSQQHYCISKYSNLFDTLKIHCNLFFFFTTCNNNSPASLSSGNLNQTDNLFVFLSIVIPL